MNSLDLTRRYHSIVQQSIRLIPCLTCEVNVKPSYMTRHMKMQHHIDGKACCVWCLKYELQASGRNKDLKKNMQDYVHKLRCFENRRSEAAVNNGPPIKSRPRLNIPEEALIGEDIIKSLVSLTDSLQTFLEINGVDKSMFLDDGCPFQLQYKRLTTFLAKSKKKYKKEATESFPHPLLDKCEKIVCHDSPSSSNSVSNTTTVAASNNKNSHKRAVRRKRINTTGNLAINTDIVRNLSEERTIIQHIDSANTTRADHTPQLSPQPLESPGEAIGLIYFTEASLSTTNSVELIVTPEVGAMMTIYDNDEGLNVPPINDDFSYNNDNLWRNSSTPLSVRNNLRVLPSVLQTTQSEAATTGNSCIDTNTINATRPTTVSDSLCPSTSKRTVVPSTEPCIMNVKKEILHKRPFANSRAENSRLIDNIDLDDYQMKDVNYNGFMPIFDEKIKNCSSCRPISRVLDSKAHWEVLEAAARVDILIYALKIPLYPAKLFKSIPFLPGEVCQVFSQATGEILPCERLFHTSNHLAGDFAFLAVTVDMPDKPTPLKPRDNICAMACFEKYEIVFPSSRCIRSTTKPRGRGKPYIGLLSLDEDFTIQMNMQKMSRYLIDLHFKPYPEILAIGHLLFHVKKSHRNKVSFLVFPPETMRFVTIDSPCLCMNMQIPQGTNTRPTNVTESTLFLSEDYYFYNKCHGLPIPVDSSTSSEKHSNMSGMRPPVPAPPPPQQQMPLMPTAVDLCNSSTFPSTN